MLCRISVCLWCLMVLGRPAAAAEAGARPNIVLIFADDCGIDAIGGYGSDRGRSLTPHIDALASGGIRFDRCYSTPLCGPSRCVLMTGRYGFRTGGLTNQTAGAASYKAEPSLAGVLKSAGYATAMAGKWRQMSDSPGDWGFDEFITDPTAGGYFWKNTYTKNGREVTTPEPIYYPDAGSDFAVEFIERHKASPFYFYLAEHLIHGPILKTPDSAEGATPAQLYDDNLRYLDKAVAKIVAALDRLGLREKTLILFTTDNGTSSVGYTPEHNPDGTTGKIGGRAMNGKKGQLLEGGSRVPLIANWPGTTPAGKVEHDLIDFSDLLPTVAELAGATLPADVKFDGRSFAPRLHGLAGQPREWIYVQLGNSWYAREDQWKLNEKGELFSMQDAPFVEAPVAADSTDAEAVAARKRLQAVLASLDPASGKTVPPETEKKPNRKRKRQPAAAGAAAN